jgi:hypothetical protein
MTYLPQEHFLAQHRAANMLAPPSWRFILSLVALKHGVMQRDILGPSRDAKLVAARHEAMALIYQHTHASKPGVGRYFDRDRTTVRHALVKLNALDKLVSQMPAPVKSPANEPPPSAMRHPVPASDAKVRPGKRRTALQRAVLRAYRHGVPATVLADEYGCNPLSVKVIAHHMGIKRSDFRPKVKPGAPAHG